MSSKKIPFTLVIVTYNAEKYIAACFESIEKQMSPPTQLIVIDNASTDNTQKLINEWRNHLIFPIEYIQKKHNTGFSVAYNEGINRSSAQYVIIANQDMVFESDCFEQLIMGAERHPNAYMIGPKINRYPDTDIIDTTGIVWLPDGRMLNRDEGEKDIGQRRTEEKVFGIPGTMAFINKKHLQNITPDGREMFDEDFFAYKEDTDLAWRANALGFESWYVPAAQAYHVRSAQKTGGESYTTAIQSRRSKTPLQRFLATRNCWAMYYKNTNLTYWTQHPKHFRMECKKIAYLTIFEPIIFWKGLVSFLAMIPKLSPKKQWLRQKVRN